MPVFPEMMSDRWADFSPVDAHVVIYSGGADSYTLLHAVLESFRKPDGTEADNVYTLSFSYGQRHIRELNRVADVTARLGLASRRTFLRLPALETIPGQSSLLRTSGVAVPHGHYAAENMRSTVVPGRNTLMLATALAYAEGMFPGKRVRIYYGAHSGDHHIYPDCRPEYVHAMARAVRMASDGNVTVVAPFGGIDKGAIIAAGLRMQARGRSVDYGETWTCYEGGEHPCGKCGACVERAEAFAMNGAADPLLPASI